MAIHEAAGDKVAEAIDHAELAWLYIQDDKLEQASEHLGVTERMAKAIDDPMSQADILRYNAAVYMSSGVFEQSIVAYQLAMKILKVCW